MKGRLLMKLKGENELYFFVQMFLKATGRPHLDHIYLVNNKYYLLRSINHNKSKVQKVRLIETDIDGNLKYEDDITTVLNVNTFKYHAKIVGARKTH